MRKATLTRRTISAPDGSRCRRVRLVLPLYESVGLPLSEQTGQQRCDTLSLKSNKGDTVFSRLQFQCLPRWMQRCVILRNSDFAFIRLNRNVINISTDRERERQAEGAHRFRRRLADRRIRGYQDAPFRMRMAPAANIQCNIQRRVNIPLTKRAME